MGDQSSKPEYDPDPMPAPRITGVETEGYIDEVRRISVEVRYYDPNYVDTENIATDVSFYVRNGVAELRDVDGGGVRTPGMFRGILVAMGCVTEHPAVDEVQSIGEMFTSLADSTVSRCRHDEDYLDPEDVDFSEALGEGIEWEAPQ